MSNLAHILLDPTVAKYVHTADSLPQPFFRPKWSVAYLAGKLVELRSKTGSAVLTTGLGLVQKAQARLETAVWVTSTDSIFFPVDAATWGIDLNALAVVRVPGTMAILRALDKLIRSGAFGLIILDFVSLWPPPMEKCEKKSVALSHISLSQQSRLLGLAQKHQTAIIFLTSKRCSLSVTGSLVSLRGEVGRRHVDTDLHEVQVRILKDKQRGPGWHHAERCCGPEGLC
jgi:recombination protein RecA